MRVSRQWLSGLSIAGAIALGSLLVSAQVAPISGAAGPATTLTTQTSPSPIAASQPATLPTARAEDADRIRLDFKDAPLDAVLDHLAAVANFEVIRDGTSLGRINVVSDHPVSSKEAINLLDEALAPKGYTAVQHGKRLEIVTLDKAKKSNIPVHVGADPDQIEDSFVVITQVIPVKNVDAVKLKADLAPMMGTDADITANAASNTLMITDNSANIHRIVEIVASLDKHEAMTNDIKVHQLKYADATAAAKLIMDIFAPQQSQNANLPPGLQLLARFQRAGGGGGFGGGFGGGGGGGAGGAGGTPDADKGNTGHVQASADQRTNTVVVTGPPDTLAIIDDVLTQLDNDPSANQTFFLYKVKNGQAVDIAATLNGLFTGNANVSSSAQNNRSQTNSSTGNRVSNNSSSFGGSSFGGSSGGVGGSSSSFGQSSGQNRSNGGNNTSNIFTGANGNRAGGSNGGAGGAPSGISDLIGQVLVVPDADTNSLLVAANSKYEQRIRDIIKELDRPVPQVLIKVLIAEVTHDNSLDLGTDFSVLNIRQSGNGSKLQSTLGAAAAAASSAAPGGLVLSTMENNVNIKLQALAQENKLDVLSRPYILTSDNQEADITVGNEVPFITESRVDTNDNTINTIQYQDIGIILDVIPHINPDGLVIMQVSPQISSLTGQTVPIQAGVNAPVFELRSASAYVAVKDGQTIVIGGLMQDQKTESVSKIPILGDLPYLSGLFSYKSTDKTKTELLIFLTPHVATQPEDLQPMTDDERSGLKLTPNAVQPGTFQDQMRGMQLGDRKAPPATEQSVPPPVQQTPPPNPSGLGEPPLPGTGGK